MIRMGMVFALVPIALSFITRIYRWGYIVRAVEPNASFRSMFSATQIAFLVNFTVGMRSGEFVRPLVLSRLTGVSFSKAFATNMLDRIADLVGLIVVLSITLVAFQRYNTPQEVNGQLFAIVVIVIAAAEAAVALAIIIAAYRQRQTIEVEEFDTMHY